MKFQYYNPHISLFDVFKSALVRREDAEESLHNYFRNITNKKYILITNSCRSALHLAWSSIGRSGEVITSPLTCRVAVDAIESSKNIPVFADIEEKTLTIDPKDIEKRITGQTIGIQAIHFGGNPCEMGQLENLAKKNDLIIIEDCAQGLGAMYRGKQVGSFGDIACFSLVKNAYGIGGGIFATNNKDYYEKAKQIHHSFEKQPSLVIIIRLIRAIIESNRKNYIGSILYDTYQRVKGEKKSYKNIVKQLYKASDLQIKVSSRQINKLSLLHSKREKLGKKYTSTLLENGINIVYENKYLKSSYTKYYLYSDKISYNKLKSKLLCLGIEVMHLEQKVGSPIQKRILSIQRSVVNSLHNYNKIHDSLISLPLDEGMSNDDIENIIKVIVGEINK